MKSFIYILFTFITALAACTGQHRRVDTVLASADSLVFSAPDSAVRLLDSLTLDCASSAQLDRHALLTAKAREKAGIIVRDDTPDSMLSRSIDALGVASDHFRGRGDSLEVQTLFYRGVLLGYRGDYSEALVSLMEAADRAAETGDNFYRAMSCREQSLVHTYIYAYDQAVHLGREAIEAFTLADRPLHAAWERVNLPHPLTYSGMVEEAREMIDKLMTDSVIMANKVLRRRLYDIAINVCIECNDPASAEKYFEAYSGEGGIVSTQQLSKIVPLKLRQGDTAGALHYYNLALTACQNAADSAAADWALVDIYASRGNYKSAYALRKSLDNRFYDESNHLISHPYTTLLTDYYHNSNAENLLKRKSAEENVLTLIFIILIIVILFIVSILIYQKNLRQKDLETHIIMADFQNLARKNAELIEMQRNSPEADPDVYSLPGKLMNDFCEARYGMSSAGDSRSRFEKRAAEFIDSIDTSEVMSALEHFVDITNDNLMRRFREEFSDLPANYYKVALLSFAGFSVTSISCIIKLKEGSFRNIRSKIRRRINSSDCPDRDRFLSYFQNIRG